MTETPYVSEDNKKLADELEKCFAELPASVGILFVSISPLPEVKGEVKSLHVALGLEKKLNYDIGAAIIQQVVGMELKKRGITEMSIEMSVFVGSAGKSLGGHSEEANQTAKD